ncbi:MAG: O-antigen ligase family protein [Candidatus Omnitrophica bacterium]|nr:O-antigen ligase family protein [Candidatus Omnitrophota bacterium]
MLIILQFLVFLRPFISSAAFPYLNSLYSAFLILFLIIWGLALNKPYKNIQYPGLPLIAFCLALAVSLIFSVNKINSLICLYNYIAYLLLFIAGASLNPNDARRIVQTISIAGLVISLLALYQYFFGFTHLSNYIVKNKITDPFVLDYISRRRIFSPFITPNALGGYLAMIFPLALINKNRLWFIVPIGLALIFTGSLGAILGLFLGLIIYMNLKGGLKIKRAIPIFGLLIIIGLIFVTRSITLKTHTAPGFSALMRLDYWRETLKIIGDRPLTGVGIGNFNLALSRYAHNSYLQIWAEMGILGISAYLWLVFRSLRSAFNKLKSGDKENYAIALISAIAIFLTHNFVDFTFFLPEVAATWWIMLGLIIA